MQMGNTGGSLQIISEDSIGMHVRGGQFFIITPQWKPWDYKTIFPTHGPAIKFLGIYPKELKSYICTKTCPWMFTALSIIAKTWKQTRCSSVGEWINKLCYIQTMEYYSALKRNELINHEKTWRKLKCILLSERSQSEKATYCTVPTIWHSRTGKTIKTIKRPVVAKGWVEGGTDEAQSIFRAVKILSMI